MKITGTLTGNAEAPAYVRLAATTFDASGNEIGVGEGPPETLKHGQSHSIRLTVGTARRAARCQVGWVSWPVGSGGTVILERGDPVAILFLLRPQVPLSHAPQTQYLRH